MTMNLRYVSPTDLKALTGLQNGQLPNNPTTVQELQATANTPSSYQLKNKDDTTTTFQVAGVATTGVPQLDTSRTQLIFPVRFSDMSKVITLQIPEFDRMMREEGVYGVQRLQIYIVDADQDGDQDMLVTHSGLIGAYFISNDPTIPQQPYRGYMETNPLE